jgi:thiol:disulfide interchange protein DsbC
MKSWLIGLALLASCVSTGVLAAVEPAVDKAIRAALHGSRPDLPIRSVEATPIAGLYAVQIENGPVLYTSADGGHFVAGELYAVQGKRGFVNLAEQARNVERAAALKTVNEADTIVFKAKGETRTVLHVFTDVDCFYCQKFHAEIADYNAAGIEVRYLAWPREGIPSGSYNKIATAWCAKNPGQTLTQLKQRVPIPLNVCDDNPVASQLALGQRMGVQGTPSLVAPDGMLLPGYLPAADLVEALGLGN